MVVGVQYKSVKAEFAWLGPDDPAPTTKGRSAAKAYPPNLTSGTSTSTAPTSLSARDSSASRPVCRSPRHNS